MIYRIHLFSFSHRETTLASPSTKTPRGGCRWQASRKRP